MLEIDVHKRLGEFNIEASFVTNGAGVTALFGHSGAGKSSIIKMIAGLLRPDRGRIVVNNRCLFDKKRGIDIRPEKRRFGCVFQEDRLFPHLSVQDNLTYGLKRTPKSERHIALGTVVDLLGIDHLLQRHPATLSGGEKQRVAIGRALLASPLMLLMDEPLASLDTARKAEVLPFIARLPKELSIPIIYVSHSVDEILNLAHMLVFLSNGSVAAKGSVEELAAQPEFQQIAGRAEAGVVFATRVVSHHPEDGMTRLEFTGGYLSVMRIDIPVGETVRVRVHPKNVGISLTPVPGTSIQNFFAATVESITDPHLGTPVDVKLRIGKAPLLVTITPKAAFELDLKPGKEVFAMIKSVSVSLGSALDTSLEK